MKIRPTLSVRSFMGYEAAQMARDLWLREGLPYGVRPDLVELEEVEVRVSGRNRAVYFVSAFGPEQDTARCEHCGAETHDSGDCTVNRRKEDATAA